MRQAHKHHFNLIVKGTVCVLIDACVCVCVCVRACARVCVYQGLSMLLALGRVRPNFDRLKCLLSAFLPSCLWCMLAALLYQTVIGLLVLASQDAECTANTRIGLRCPPPSPEAISDLGLRSTEGMGRAEFGETIRKAHAECGIEVLETCVFLEPHASGKRHLNCLIRVQKQFRWKAVKSYEKPAQLWSRQQRGQ